MPWWLKIAAKIALSRLPVPYRVWRRLGVFRHGDMACPEHAIETFRRYLDIGRRHAEIEEGFVSLELGPGDSLLGGVAALAAGASRAWLVDAGKYAEWDMEAAARVVELARERFGWKASKYLPEGRSALEERVRARLGYLTDGVASMRKIPTGSVDFFWSNVVLEHVPLRDLNALFAELRRVAKDDAVGVHGVDFRDHLGGGLNNLRFSERVWEGRLMSGSGFYTNRVRMGEMQERMEKAGFSVTVHSQERWEALPLPQEAMAEPYRSMSEEDLRVAEAVFVLRPC